MELIHNFSLIFILSVGGRKISNSNEILEQVAQKFLLRTKINQLLNENYFVLTMGSSWVWSEHCGWRRFLWLLSIGSWRSSGTESKLRHSSGHILLERIEKAHISNFLIGHNNKLCVPLFTGKTFTLLLNLFRKTKLEVLFRLWLLCKYRLYR